MSKCECPEIGNNDPSLNYLYDPIKELPYRKHSPGECECVNNLKLYKRNDKILILCSICCLPSDIELDKTDLT